jgi:hypothetical protein
MRASPLGILALIVAAACGADGVSGPSGPLPHAAAMATCGPADGPAVAIYLAASPITDNEPQVPHVRIAIWTALDQLAGRSWAVGDAGEAHATWHAAPSNFVVAERGEIVVHSVSADNAIDASVDLIFANGRVRGRFTSTWLSLPIPCG